MEKFGKSQPVTRREDVRFLTGEGRYVDDIAPANAYQTFVFRSPVAHGVITSLDVSEARAAEGVKAVYTCADLEAAGVDTMISATLVKNQDGTDGARTDRHVLAKDRVRFVGEPVALVVAETLSQARDAAELIAFDYDELPAKLDLAAGGETLHDTAPNNVAYDWALGDEAATNAAFDAAARVVSLDVEDNRVIVNAMEPRGCYAEMEGDRLHVAVNGQGVWGPKGNISSALGMDADDVRVTNPDTGGGFGMKAFVYPENILVPFAARALRHPVRWMSERTRRCCRTMRGVI
mgnify:CR=1 FL=1